MTDEKELKRRASVMHQWMKRRRQSLKLWNADDLWARIKTNWPTMSDADCEFVYQHCW